MSAPRTWLHQKLAKEREKEKEKAREKELRENERDQRERERDRDRDRDRDREKELPRERERERDKAAERAAKEQRDEEREEGFLLPSFNNPSGLVTAQSLSTIPPTYDNPVMTRPGTISSGAPLAAGGLLTPAAGAPTAHAAGPAPAGTSLPPRPTKLSHMDLLDTSITGSTDLSGEKKPRIDHHRMPDSSILESKYVLGRKLGQGSFGTVRLAEERATGVTWAIKSIKKARGSTDRLEQLAREVAVMKRVKHPHIVQLREVVETPTKIYLVMEYCRGGELVRRVAQKRYCSEQDCRIIMTRLLEAVAYLHDHGVVHRDLKPENVLLSTHDPGDPLYIKVSDFGLATFSGACKMMENICGTPFYMAPEIVANLGYSHQCDVWSLGVMLYLLLCGYRRECEHALQKMIANRKIEFIEPMNGEVSPAAKDLLQRMLQFDPAERITAREALQHPWTNGKEDAPISLGQTTVLQMMKSYNAERRLKRLFNVVMAAVRFQRGGVYGGSIDEYDSDLSEEAGLASEDETEAPTNSVSQTFTDDADEPPRVFSNDSIVCPASGPAAVNVTGSADVPLVVPPTNTNRIKRPTTATRPNHRAKIRGYVLQHGPGAGATPRGASQSPQVSSDDIQGEKPASSSGASSAASSASGPAPAAFLSIRRSLGAALAHHSPLPMRTSSSDLPTQMNHLLVSDKPVGRSRRNSTPSALTAPANNTLPRRRPSAFAKETVYAAPSGAASGGGIASAAASMAAARRRSMVASGPGLAPVATASSKGAAPRKAAR